MIIAAWPSALKTLGTKLDDVGVLASTRFGTVKANKYRQFSASNLAERGGDS
jgi:hypothetical protein